MDIASGSTMVAVRRLLRSIVRKPPPRRPDLVPQFLDSMDLPVFEGRPRLYLIASTPRCGSHFLGHALGDCQHFGVPLEYLHVRHLKALRTRHGTTDDVALFQRLVRTRSGATGWFGTKAHWSQFAPFEDGPLLHALGGIDRAIWIYRRDLVAQAISYAIAEQTGQWVSGAPAVGEARYDYGLIVAMAANVAGQNAAWARFFAERFERPALRVVYEDLASDQEATFRSIADFLDPDAPARPAASARTRKQGGTPNDDWRRRFLDDLRDDDRHIIEPQSW